MKRLPSRLPQLPLVPVTALALLVCMGAAQAQQSPYYFGGALGVTHENNIFRTGGSTPDQSDTIRTATLLAGLDQTIGRQRLRGDLSVRDNSFQSTSTLNNLAYGMNAALDWSTIERLSGTLSLSANQSLARFNPGDAPTLTKKNVQKNETVSASVRVGLVTRLSADASVSHYNIDYSASEFAFREMSQDTVSAGLRYTFSGALTAGAALRYLNGRYPRYLLVDAAVPGVFLADRFSGTNLDLTAEWVPTGSSTVTARVSLGEQSHKEGSSRDYSGVTGQLGWDWRTGGKLRVNTVLARDSGNSTNVFTTGGVSSGEYDSSRISTSLRTGVFYELTSKIALNASGSYATRDLVNSRLQDPDGRDRTATLSLGARWSPLRTVSLSCDVSAEKRGTNNSALSVPFDANSVGCTAQLVLQ